VDANDNIERMRSAGLIDDSASPLADEFYSVINDITSPEVDALVSLKRRLDESGIPTAPLTADLAGDEKGVVIL
jgi:hypothetical protein